jgi:hypothetical protein
MKKGTPPFLSKPGKKSQRLVDDPDREFFHPKHFVALFWALVAGLLISLATIVWQARQEPQKVSITNPDTTVRTVIVGDTAMRNYLETMIRELRANRRSPLPSTQSSGSTPPILPESAFSFPSKVRGYGQSHLGRVATGTCPRGEFPPGSEVSFSVRVPNSQLVGKLSPLFVSIQRRDKANYVTLIFEQRYKRQASTDLTVDAPAEPGSYDLVYGYYLLSELNTVFPPFYSKACKLTVR